jgi:hypothetical protein
MGRRDENRDVGKSSKCMKLQSHAKPSAGSFISMVTFHLHCPGSIPVPIWICYQNASWFVVTWWLYNSSLYFSTQWQWWNLADTKEWST